MSEAVKALIKDMFVDLNKDVKKAIWHSNSVDEANSKIVKIVTSRVTSKCKGYMSTLFTGLSKETLSKPSFKSKTHSNAFYQLNLDDLISSKYDFDVAYCDSIKSIKDKLFFEQLDKGKKQGIEIGVAVGVGVSVAVGKILYDALVLDVKVCIPWLIGRAVLYGLLSGLGSGAFTWGAFTLFYKHKHLNCAKKTLADLEQDMYCWVDGIVNYYREEVNKLEKSFED